MSTQQLFIQTNDILKIYAIIVVEENNLLKTGVIASNKINRRCSMKLFGKYLCLIFAICLSITILSGCSNKKAVVINLQSGIKEPAIVDPNAPAVIGRVVKFGKQETEDFGPSFEFDKLKR